MRYDTIIFDLDGTLLNTLDDLTDAVNYALTQMGWHTRTLEEVRSFVGNGVKLLMDRAAPQDSSESDRARALEIFKTHYALHMRDKTAPYPGVLDLLNALKNKGCALAVCSNKFDAAVQELAQDFFPGLMSATAGENEGAGIPKKPHPAMVQKIISTLNADPARTVYIGDADTDIATAHNAGLTCISVTWGFREEAFLRASGADAFAHAPAELLELLG